MKPPVAWIGTNNVPRFKSLDGTRVPNPAWKPFVVSISKSEYQQGKRAIIKDFYASQSSIKATFTALSSFYGYLAQEGAVPGNPVALIRQKSKFVRKAHTQAPVRRISLLQWDYVIENIERMVKDDPVRYERTLFVMECLFGMYLRISELVADERSTPTMGDFRKDRDGNWWFHVTGKGNKDRIVTVSDTMLKALKRYRLHLGATPLPAPNDPLPLVAKTHGKGPVTSPRLIRGLVQECFDVAFLRMKADGLAEEAQDLKAATVHWLRHTGISEDVKIRPREHVRDVTVHADFCACQ